tara:strand:- start:217 stop:576 length:360 start_codon:yes stop_codon:yes gene_type:complete
MTHFRIDIQLPLLYNLKKGEIERKKVPEKHFLDTYNELLKIAGGVNTTNFPIMGSWICPKTKELHNDKSIVFSILVKSQDRITALKVPKIIKLQKYKEILIERFDQKAIYMVATRCTWL